MIEGLKSELKLSEAMRNGAGCSLPKKNSYFSYDGDGTCSTCAIGAILLGLLDCDVEALCEFNEPNPFDGNYNTVIRDTYRHFYYAPCICPAGDKRGLTMPYWDATVYLNDHCDWTREQIADWLEEEGF